MSCEVKSFSSIPDLKKVQELLGFSQDENWLNAIYYSLSPTGDTIAFGHGSKIIILGSHWSNTHQLPKYTISWKGELENPNDIITSMICLPIYGMNVSSGSEWTCIAIGLASGLVLFYADSGVQIFSQKWHPEPVQSIKAQSGKHMNEEIHIGYLSCICILQGTQLFQVLKGLKQCLSKNVTSNSSKTNISQFPDTVQCRKWEYRAKNITVNDVVIVGGQKSTAYDYMLEQSLTGGYFTKCRSAPPQNSLVIGVGVKPYIGFHYAKEGFIHADLGDVAKAVANKVISSLPGWLFKSSSTTQQTQEQSQPITPGEPMLCRFGICDIQRQAYNVWLAPGNDLAVVADNLSRIVLVDCNHGTALRIWKGYRDAQCAFIKVTEKTNKNDRAERRKCMFLVIYAPRRSCLEIWALQRGPKVAAFTVNKNGQLIYNSYGLMGVTPGAKTKHPVNTCLFFDPSDDSLKEIIVPFHCALDDSNSKTAKDIHLLRRIKMFLRGDSDVDTVINEIESSCLSFQTDDIRLQCLEMLSKNKRVTPIIFKKVIDVFLQQIQPENTVVELRPSSESDSNKCLPILLENYRKLVEFYLAIKCSNESNNHTSCDENLCLIETDIETIQKLLDLSHEQNTSNSNNVHVTFHEKVQEDDFIDFLSVFDVETARIYLRLEKVDHYGTIGSKLFARFFEKGFDLQSFLENAENSTISSEDFMKLVLYYCLEKPFSYSKSEEVIEDMTREASIIQHICDLAGDEIKYEYNEICPWWQNIREILLESPSAAQSLLSAIVCRNLSHKLSKRESSPDENFSGEDEVWENVSQEAAQWSLLIGKLEDISVLGAVISCPRASLHPELPTIPYEKPDCSLKGIMSGGKGVVAELVGKWMTNSGLSASKIVENAVSSTEQTDSVSKYLQLLREHFPFSLQSGVLLCQMTWEYMCHWSKNLPNLEYLKAGLKCLDAFQLEDFALKHGLCCMIWNAHLKIPLEATKKLIHKAGRLPKEKLCQQDIGISDALVPDMLEHCLVFFKHFSSSLEHNKRDLKFEEVLQEGLIPLSLLTLQQNSAIKQILQLHIELCKVLHLIAVFSIKISKPMQLLFDGMSNQTFFTEMNRQLSYVLPAPDLILQKHRKEFLFKAITASMDLIREDLERLYVLDHISYMQQIEELADMWKLEKIALKKHQIVEIYAHGWDVYAEELLESIVDKQDIGVLLMEIAARRLNLFAANSGKLWAQIASVGPLLTDYLDTLKTRTNGIQITEVSDDIDLERIISLSGKAFQCLSTKDSRQLRIAGQLLDACITLKEYSEPK